MTLETQLVDSKTALKIIGCSSSSLATYIKRRKIFPYKKIGGKNFFKEEDVRNFLRPDDAINKHKNKANAEIDQAIIDKWRVNKKDNASADVKIGIYTEKIRQLESEIKGLAIDNPDFPQMRKSLIYNVVERRRLLNYLQISDYQRYRIAIERIELMKAKA